MESVSITVPGRIKGKGRPKFARRGAFVHAYTPADTANCEAMVRSLAAAAMGGRAPFQGPLMLNMADVEEREQHAHVEKCTHAQ
jgi:Holliday junction resolvase RusA-like endonuclease